MSLEYRNVLKRSLSIAETPQESEQKSESNRGFRVHSFRAQIVGFCSSFSPPERGGVPFVVPFDVSFVSSFDWILESAGTFDDAALAVSSEESFPMSRASSSAGSKIFNRRVSYPTGCFRCTSSSRNKSMLCLSVWPSTDISSHGQHLVSTGVRMIDRHAPE